MFNYSCPDCCNFYVSAIIETVSEKDYWTEEFYAVGFLVWFPPRLFSQTGALEKASVLIIM